MKKILLLAAGAILLGSIAINVILAIELEHKDDQIWDCCYSDSYDYYEEDYDDSYYDEDDSYYYSSDNYHILSPDAKEALFHQATSFFQPENVLESFLLKTLDIDGNDEEWNNPDDINYLKSRYYDFVAYYQWGLFDEYRYQEYTTYTIQAELMAYVAENFDRSENNISTLFEQHKESFYSVVPDRLYRDSYMREYVNTLINIYEYYETEDLMDYYQSLEDTEYLYPDDSDLVDIYNENLSRKFYREDDQWYEYSEVFWLHTFWWRRHAEGNNEVVYSILLEIQEHYESM